MAVRQAGSCLQGRQGGRAPMYVCAYIHVQVEELNVLSTLPVVKITVEHYGPLS